MGARCLLISSYNGHIVLGGLDGVHAAEECKSLPRVLTKTVRSIMEPSTTSNTTASKTLGKIHPMNITL